MKTPAAKELQLEHAQHPDNRRRRKKGRHTDGHSWDSAPGKRRRSSREDKSQMFWMLVGGGTLFAIIVGGVLLFLSGGENQEADLPGVTASSTDSTPKGQTTDAPVAKSDIAILKEIEPLAKKFLEATSVDQMLPLVRHANLTEKRMRGFYPGGNILAPGMSAFNTQGELTRDGAVYSVGVRTRDYDEKALAFIDTPTGMKIDWESWAGWSEMAWEDFLEAKPTYPKVFRLSLSAIEYYNIAFTDDKKWQSYRLLSPDGKHSIYGYAERGSVLNSRLRPPPDAKQTTVILALKFPENATAANQVIIDRLVTEGWVLDKEGTP